MTPRFKPKIRKAQIIEHASTLTILQGLEGWTIRELAKRVGVSERAIYYHFPSIVTIRRRVLREAGKHG